MGAAISRCRRKLTPDNILYWSNLIQQSLNHGARAVLTMAEATIITSAAHETYKDFSNGQEVDPTIALATVTGLLFAEAAKKLLKKMDEARQQTQAQRQIRQQVQAQANGLQAAANLLLPANAEARAAALLQFQQNLAALQLQRGATAPAA